MFLETTFSTELFTKAMEQDLVVINAKMKDLLEELDANQLREAALFSCLETAGKKIRPVLFLETIKLFRTDIDPFVSIAAAIEFCHVYSLIHDDLPAMDDDDFRRGQPSCHKKFNEAVALLTGNSLLTYSFEIISRNDHISPAIRCMVIEEFAKAVGSSGMMGGQILDLELKDQNASLQEIQKLHYLKTSKLIIFSCISAAMVCEASANGIMALTRFARDLGLLFQITDDMLDYNDGKRSECNIVNSLGVDKAKYFSEESAKDAILSLDIFGDKANILKSLVFFVLNRKN